MNTARNTRHQKTNTNKHKMCLSKITNTRARPRANISRKKTTCNIDANRQTAMLIIMRRVYSNKMKYYKWPFPLYKNISLSNEIAIFIVQGSSDNGRCALAVVVFCTVGWFDNRRRALTVVVSRTFLSSENGRSALTHVALHIHVGCLYISVFEKSFHQHDQLSHIFFIYINIASFALGSILNTWIFNSRWLLIMFRSHTLTHFINFPRCKLITLWKVFIVGCFNTSE